MVLLDVVATVAVRPVTTSIIGTTMSPAKKLSVDRPSFCTKVLSDRQCGIFVPDQGADLGGGGAKVSSPLPPILTLSLASRLPSNLPPHTQSELGAAVPDTSRNDQLNTVSELIRFF